MLRLLAVCVTNKREKWLQRRKNAVRSNGMRYQAIVYLLFKVRRVSLSNRKSHRFVCNFEILLSFEK